MFGGQGKIRKSYQKLPANVCKDSSAALCGSDGEEPGNPPESGFHSKIQLHPQTEEKNLQYQCKGVVNVPFSWGANSCKG